MRASIVPSTTVDYEYYVSDPGVSFPFPVFQASIADCAPKSAQAKLQTGAALPNFMKASTSGIFVNTPNP